MVEHSNTIHMRIVFFLSQIKRFVWQKQDERRQKRTNTAEFRISLCCNRFVSLISFSLSLSVCLCLSFCFLSCTVARTVKSCLSARVHVTIFPISSELHQRTKTTKNKYTHTRINTKANNDTRKDKKNN